jgi:ribosome maturation factor RimP
LGDAQQTGSKADRSVLERTCEAALGAVGYDLVDLELGRQGRGWVLRVFIDHPQGDAPADRDTPVQRITHEDCQRASRQLSTVLDVEDPIAEPYSLEVSSPGVQRPLRKECDFLRFAGFRVRVTTSEPIDGRKSFSGTLGRAEHGRVWVEGQDVKGQNVVWDLPIAKIRKARLDEDY